MKKLSKHITDFFHAQGCVIVSTVDAGGMIHAACKGVVEIAPNGRVYLLDLYQARTFKNLQRNPHLSISGIDEHDFAGYCLKGTAKIVDKAGIAPRILKAWEDRITRRLTRRIIKNLREEKGHPSHPEASLPPPQYLIELQVEEVVDLNPRHMRKDRGENG